MSDIRVVATRTGMVLVEDIGVTVPHGVVTPIPAEKALVSKDLYRLISQRVLFQIHPGPVRPGVLPSMPELPRSQAEAPQTPREIALAEENAKLRETLDQRENVLYAALVAMQGETMSMAKKLDMLFDRVSSQSVIVQQVGTNPQAMKPQDSGVVSVDAPLFIPSEIKPKDVDTHVTVSSESQDSGVSGAQSALRRLRGDKAKA